MRNILFIQSSPRGVLSYSNQVAGGIVDRIVSSSPGVKVVVRDLAKNSIPHLDAAFVNGRALAPDKRSPAEAQALALSDTLIDELFAADILVLAVPMLNFSIPSTLKAWIDHIARGGRTFSYTEAGPTGLLKNKKAIVVTASGSRYSDGPLKHLDFQEPYLRSILGFVGITDLDVIRLEGVALGDDAVRNALTTANMRSEEIVRRLSSSFSSAV